jgi:hypothetical protein
LQLVLFWNSLVPAEQQFIINAIVFKNSKITSPHVRANVLSSQLNMINNDLASRVAFGLGLPKPTPNPTYYINNKTCCVGTFGMVLVSVEGLQVGFLALVGYPESIMQVTSMAAKFAAAGVDLIVLAETWAGSVNATYSISDATNFNAVIVADGVQGLFALSSIIEPGPERHHALQHHQALGCVPALPHRSTPPDPGRCIQIRKANRCHGQRRSGVEYGRYHPDCTLSSSWIASLSIDWCMLMLVDKLIILPALCFFSMGIFLPFQHLQSLLCAVQPLIIGRNILVIKTGFLQIYPRRFETGSESFPCHVRRVILRE